MVQRIVRITKVIAEQGICRSTIYNRISRGLFPRPISLGPRMVGWREVEIEAINAAHIRGASEDEIRALVVELEADRKNAA